MTLRIRFLIEPPPNQQGPDAPQDVKEVIAEAQAGELLTQVAYRAGVLIQQTCGGSPSCTDCRVVVKEGGAEAFEEMQFKEQSLMGNVFFITKERLACQSLVKNSCTIWIPSPQRYRKKK